MYFLKEDISFITEVIEFYWMVLKREGLMMACNMPKRVACCVVYDCIGKYVYLVDGKRGKNHLSNNNNNRNAKGFPFPQC